MTHADESDLEILSAAAANVVHCPESNLKLGSGVCPVPELLGRGVPVALGTDGAASNNDLDLFGEMRTAGLLASGVGSTPGALVSRDILRMATLEGARALGLGDCVGSLVPGKWADLCCVNLRMPRTLAGARRASHAGLRRLLGTGHRYVGCGSALVCRWHTALHGRGRGTRSRRGVARAYRRRTGSRKPVTT